MEAEKLKNIEEVNKSNPIVNICGDIIDLRKVERVGKIHGDSAWKRYSVYFTGGGVMEIFENRKHIDGNEVCQMERETFIALWLNLNKS
jgi:hypothetical protein